LIQSGHLGPSGVPVKVATIWCPSLGGCNEAAGIHHTSEQCGGSVAICCARATVGHAGGRISTLTPRDLSLPLIAAFRQGLMESGFDEGQNVAIEFLYADNQIDRLPGLVDELVRRPVNVIVANVLAALAAKNATTTIPILFVTGSDPVKDGLVASLNRPGGNITGVSFVSGALGTKRLEILRQLTPNAKTIAMLVQLDADESVLEQRQVQAAARATDQQLIVFNVDSAADIENAFATMVTRGVGALYVGTGPFTTSHRERLAELAARNAIPAMYPLRQFVAVGGLMSYGASINDAYRQAGIYAARILKGERPADLPVIQATKFNFVFNLKAAKALGLAVPERVLSLADEVIE
jgi:putative ABC transport system substrate-binding protein